MLQIIPKYVNPIKLSRFNTISICDNTMERGVTLRYSVMIYDEKAVRIDFFLNIKNCQYSMFYTNQGRIQDLWLRGGREQARGLGTAFRSPAGRG